MCPVCYAEGENADNDCESIVENEACLEKDPVCALTVSTGESADGKFRDRDCLSRKEYQETKDDCEHYKDCKIVMCETSGCKAEFSAQGIPIYFRVINKKIVFRSVCVTCSF